jgi:hypothetical protein
MEGRASRRGLFQAAALVLATVILSAVLLRSGQVSETAPKSAPAAAAVNADAPDRVCLYGHMYDASVRELILPWRNIPGEELLQKLPLFPELERVELPECRLDYAVQDALYRSCPGVEFLWPVEICGQVFLSDTETVSLAGREDLTFRALPEIRERAGHFANLKTVDLSGCSFSYAGIRALRNALSGVEVIWDMDLYGVTVSSAAEEIDLSGHPVKDGGALLKKMMPMMPHLKKVVMCDCGLSDKVMDRLNSQYEDVRFVWMVRIKWAAIPTDSDFFIPYKESGVAQTGTQAGLSALRYCPDLIALDVGHSETADLSFLAVMPHLQYLIIAENYAYDISLIGELKELRWLEMFQCHTRDLSPLLNCTSLENLNICYVSTPGDNLLETLRQMTWLKRLWCSGVNLSRSQLQELREALPDTEIWCKAGDESTGSTWRFDESYYEMRDAFHMYYMDIEGHRTRRMSPEELARIHKKYWNY